MIPILYTKDENLFLSNGLGRLSDCISCTVTEERNGIYECEFVYPLNGKHYEDIQEGCLIYCSHDDTGDCQPFEIYKRSATIDGLVTFNAHHISYRLSNIIAKPFSIESASVGLALTQLAENAIGGCPFTLQTTKSTTGVNFSVPEPDSIRARLGGVEGSILDAFGGGEYKFDKFTVTLYDARGVDNGVSIRYGKNLTDITAEQSIEGRYTGVVPFWKDDSGIMVTLPEWYILSTEIPTETAYWTDENETIIRDENGNPFEFAYLDIALAPMDLSDQWEEPPTVAQLREKATSKLAASKAWETEENIEIDFVSLWQTSEYEDVAALQRVQLCDTVSIYYPALEVEIKKKVIKTVYNVLLDRFDSVELGMPQTSLSDSIVNRVSGIMTDYVRSSRMQAAIENATKLIQGGLGGHVVFNVNADGEPEEILIMDTDDVMTAVNVIRINQNGIGFSQNGYQGPFETAWTIDGHFVADFIDTGILNADLIRAGTISSSDDSTFWNLDTGIIETATATRRTRLQAGRIAFYHNSNLTGHITTALWNNDDNKEGYTILTNNKFLGLGYSGSTEGTGVSVIVINNGVNPDGRTERIIFRDTVYFRESARFWDAVHLDATNNTIYSANIEASLYPSTDYSGGALNRVYLGIVPPQGSGNYRFYMVASYMFAFAQGVYFSYTDGDTSIYSSKTINQASDEHLKNVYPYEDKYDDLIEELEPITYAWKDHPGGAKYAGLGARKTKSLLDKCGIENSGFVSVHKEEGEEDVYSIDYNELSVMLLHKVQKQQAQIKELKNTLADVLKRLEKLEAANANT